MSARDIVNAMELLDEDLILEAKKTPRKRRISYRKFFLLAAVIALLGTLMLSAVAAADKAGWFRDMFAGQSDTELTPRQETFIRDNTVAIGSSQTQNGYTLTLDSAFTDGKIAYFKFTLTVPDDTQLDADWYGDKYGASLQNEAGDTFFMHDRSGAGRKNWTNYPLEGKENSIQLLYTEERTYIENVPPVAGHIWNIHIYGLEAGYRDDEVGLRREPLTEGYWSFEVQFPESCERELELIDEPVTIQCVLGGGPLIPGVNHTDPVEVTSFRIRALTAEICFKYAHREQINGNFGEIYAVMKDGTRILLNRHFGMPNYVTFTFDAPLDLDQVDHILFPDGTTLPVGG